MSIQYICESYILSIYVIYVMFKTLFTLQNSTVQHLKVYTSIYNYILTCNTF